MLEMQSCFADALAEGAKGGSFNTAWLSHRVVAHDANAVKLRGRGPDINIHSLFIHFVIERHREALLWSAIVAKADANQDGYLNLDEFQAFLKSLGVSGHKSWYKIAQPRRHIDTSKLLSEAGIDQPRQTRFDYTSQNGYALLLSDHQSMGIHHYPDYGKAGSGNFCTFDADHCFGGNWTTAPTNSTSDIFKHAAFEIPRCGDCIIAGLLGQSSKGLEAFLPPRSREGSSPQQRFATKANAGETPVLPTTARYEGVDFSLGSVLPAGDTAREFVTRLLLRYSVGLQVTRCVCFG